MLINLNEYQSVHTKLHYSLFSNRFFIQYEVLPPLKAVLKKEKDPPELY